MEPIQCDTLNFIYKHVDERKSNGGKSEMQETGDEISQLTLRLEK